VKPIVSMLEAGGDVHYLSPITGHAFRKIMRSRKPFRYVIDDLPEPPQVFTELIKLSEQQGAAVSEYEAYQTWNMGIGYVVIAPDEFEEEIVRICGSEGVACHRLGRLAEGDRQVEIVPKGISYT
jgi:phosphoribosylformylglycinamidine cyclo-ligase